MKKILSVSLLFCMIISLYGCKSDEPIKDIPETQQPTTEHVEVTEPVIAQLPMHAVSLPISVDYKTDEDGQVLFTYSRPTMHLVCPDPDVADKILVDFMSRLDSFHIDAEQIETESTSAQDPNFYNISYNPMRVDQGVLSLYGQAVSYQGLAHPTTICIAANYDMVTGDVLTLGSIMGSEAALQSLSQLLIDAVTEIKTDKQIMGGYEQIIGDKFNADVSNNEDWFFDNTGLNFYFSPYEIAPYSSGIITVNIPYEQLTQIIDPAYFPPEKDMVSGCVFANLYADYKGRELTQMAEIILDEDGERIILYTDKSVYNVQITTGQWDSDGVHFIPSNTVFATSALTPGDGVLVQASIPDVMPNLQLQYTSNGEVVTVYIHQSGMDGSIYLTSF